MRGRAAARRWSNGSLQISRCALGAGLDDATCSRCGRSTSPIGEIVQTPSAQSPVRSGPEKVQTPSARFSGAIGSLVSRFPLPWSHYVRLLGLKNEHARSFYEIEALRGGWSIRQLARQIDSQFYERTALSRDKTKMLTRGARARPDDRVTPEEEIKEPYVLEFLGLRNEYSETDLEEALIRHLETFLLELGGDFTFVGRQRRLRVGEAWYRVDLLFFHQRLRCLVVIENPPVGLVLCAKKDHAVAKYALDGLRNKVLAAEYRTALPTERVLVEEIEKTRRQIEGQRETWVGHKTGPRSAFPIRCAPATPPATCSFPAACGRKPRSWPASCSERAPCARGRAFTACMGTLVLFDTAQLRSPRGSSAGRTDSDSPFRPIRTIFERPLPTAAPARSSTRSTSCSIW